MRIPLPLIPGSPLCPIAALEQAVFFIRLAAPSAHALAYYDVKCLDI